MISITESTRTNARIKVIVSFPWTFNNPDGVSTSRIIVSDDSDFPEESLVPPDIESIE